MYTSAVNVHLYELIISQLIHDGFSYPASILASLVNLHPQPNSHLNEIFLKHTKAADPPALPKLSPTLLSPAFPSPSLSPFGPEFAPGYEDKEEKNEAEADELFLNIKRQFNHYLPPLPLALCYSNTHRSACRCAQFSPDGNTVVSGCADGSVSVFDVERMKGCKHSKLNECDDSPRVKLIYTNNNEINEIGYHPTKDLIAVGTKENSINLYEPHSKKAKPSLVLTDTSSVKSVCFHPLGDHLYVGTAHNIVRLYDLETQQCYQSKSIREAHSGAITMVRCAPNGAVTVSCSVDGSLKLWDGRCGIAVRSVLTAHGSRSVCSATFSRNGRHILSCGMDARIKLWDVRFGEPIMTIIVNGNTVNNKYYNNAVFSHDESFIFGTSEPQSSVICWSSKNGKEIQHLVGHTNTIRYIASSPIENSVATSCFDSKLRFFSSE